MTEVNRASCLILNSNKLLLVREKKEKCWSLPGGIIEKDEAYKDAAQKHAESISGIKARIIQLFGIYECQKDGKNFEEHVFESDIPSDSSSDLKEDDKFEAKWFSLSAAKKEELCPELKLVFEDL